jgi:hypothetical protein
MAHLRKQVLGQLQGSIASIVIKYRNGKPYVASKPGKCNTGKDPVTLFKQSQGRFIGKLSSVIYKIEILKKFGPSQMHPKDIPTSKFGQGITALLRTTIFPEMLPLSPLVALRLLAKQSN